MIPQITPPHTTEGVSTVIQQTAEPHRPDLLSVADLVGLGFVLIVTLLVSRQLVSSCYKRYQLHHFIVSLQRRATLERQLQRKAFQVASPNGLSQSP